MTVRPTPAADLSSAAVPESLESPARDETVEPRFACPRCQTVLVPRERYALVCPQDGERFERVDGIWRFLTPERATYFQPFIDDYETIRQAEGRGSQNPAYYRALPERDLTGRFTEDWRVRSSSYNELVHSIIKPFAEEMNRALNILDLGAGNCWLSNQLSRQGHHLVAIDLLTNDFDGLGAHRFFDTRFIPAQAEFDSLPLPDASFDLVIFNGSIHYSIDYQATLAEALRVLREDGRLVILDTPVYEDPSSGDRMIREREDQFQRTYGFPSNALPSEGYMTHRRLAELGVQLGLRWRVTQPWYGLRWALRPWKAWLLRRREPARFLLITGRRVTTPVERPRSDKVIKRLSRLWLRARYQVLQRRRHRSHTLEHVAGYPIAVLPDVFNPALFRSGAFLAETLSSELIPQGSSVLDVGTGTGIGAIASANWASRVVAVDINPEAVRCAHINALMNNVDDRIEARDGDLFERVNDERFDVVLFNPPYFRGEPKDWYDHAWRSVDTFDRFVTKLPEHLTASGYALLVLSSDGESESFLTSLRENDYTIHIVARREFANEQMTIYQVHVNG